MKLGRGVIAAGVLASAIATGAVWAARARSDAPPRSSSLTASRSNDARVAAMEARLTRIEQALTVLVSREATSGARAVARAAAEPEPTSEVAGDDLEPPMAPDVALRELYTSLDQRSEMEGPDPGWRPEPAIHDAFRSLSTRPQLVSTDCVAAFCRVELALRSSDDRDSTTQQISQLVPFTEGTLYRHDPAEPLRLTLYVQRPGHPLGDEPAPPSPTEP